MSGKALIPIIILVSLIAACSLNEAEKEAVTERIQYDVPIMADDPSLNWWVNNIEGSDRESLVNWFFEAVESGEYIAYDYFNKPLNIEEFRNIGIDTLYMTLVREQPPYEEYDTMVVQMLEKRNIEKVRFLEEWYWSDKHVAVEKKVLGMAPVVVRNYGGKNYNELLFWIYFDERYPGLMK